MAFPAPESQYTNTNPYSPLPVDRPVRTSGDARLPAVVAGGISIDAPATGPGSALRACPPVRPTIG
ncbi:hypothetical protein EXIGLDRAFT_361131 [Exidia glandulosa HHB12029]|uniref:Uncharacterized protein n=1 Tax=Exidia glandulosa HHB12029 TaxID=1314781 RepID=A0A165C5T5_EXIGL|nr:hypothetical protein EXIGLDRAFT_361131 [Exidia glandulosa HHB12029]